jgi:hypothetical protein
MPPLLRPLTHVLTTLVLLDVTRGRGAGVYALKLGDVFRGFKPAGYNLTAVALSDPGSIGAEYVRRTYKCRPLPGAGGGRGEEDATRGNSTAGTSAAAAPPSTGAYTTATQTCDYEAG